MHDAGSTRGMTLLEMAIVVVLISILAAILTPVLANYVDEARLAKAQADAKTIAEAITRFERDVGRYPMYSTGTGFLSDTNANVARLEGPGTVVTEGVMTAWTSVAGSADPGCSPGCVVDTIANQLLTNGPSYPTTSSLAKPFNWKGPYLDIQADPWGRRYLVNIINLRSVSTNASFVLSAGQNGVVETSFVLSRSSAISPGGDDLIYRIK